MITHEQRLEDCEVELDAFLGQCQQLGNNLGCLLVQLPPSLAHDPCRDRRFFESLRQRHAGPVAVEPRHASWQAARSMLIDLRIAQVAASPARFAADAQPAGWPGLIYWRLHGEPRIYHSEYSQQCLQQLAEWLKRSHAAGASSITRPPVRHWVTPWRWSGICADASGSNFFATVGLFCQHNVKRGAVHET